jgi:hypothetical protein
MEINLQKRLQESILELANRIEKAKEDRNVEFYQLKAYYRPNELYISMLEDAELKLIKELNQTLINKNK